MSSTQLLRIILLAGLLLRLGLPLVLGPFNNDDHLRVVESLLEEGRLPHSAELNQSFHPPLYYLLGAMAHRLAGPAGLRAVSVVASCLTLVILHSLLTRWTRPGRAMRPLLLALLAFHPQFVMHGSFVSNDPLAVLFGVAAFWILERYVRKPSRRDALALGVCVGLGLSTKATFLAFLLPLVVAVVWCRAGARRQMVVELALLSAPVILLGSYKFLDNWLVLGKPFFSNLDLALPWVAQQQPTVRGLGSFIDVNVWKLVREPTVAPSTVHSLPLMLYGSFWYQYIPESTFRGNVGELRWVGSAIYLLALFPTAAGLVGAGSLLRRSSTERRDEIRFELIALAIVLANLALILWAGLRYDVWSVFQARLLFPSVVGLVVCLTVGLAVLRGFRRLAPAVHAACWMLVVLFGVYFATEAVKARRDPVDPATRFHMPYRVPMERR